MFSLSHKRVGRIGKAEKMPTFCFVLVMDGQTDGRTDGWMDGWINGWIGGPNDRQSKFKSCVSATKKNLLAFDHIIFYFFVLL